MGLCNGFVCRENVKKHKQIHNRTNDINGKLFYFGEKRAETHYFFIKTDGKFISLIMKEATTNIQALKSILHLLLRSPRVPKHSARKNFDTGKTLRRTCNKQSWDEKFVFWRFKIYYRKLVNSLSVSLRLPKFFQVHPSWRTLMFLKFQSFLFSRKLKISMTL